MKFKLMVSAIIVLGALLLPRLATADALDDKVQEIGKVIQCPVCQGISVTDSPSELAGQMRALIRKKLEAGETRDQIVAYFVDRYGESILLEPPKQGLSLGIWAAPFIALALGAVIVFFAVRSWARGRQSEIEDLPGVSAEELRQYQERVQREVHRQDDGGP